MFFIHKAIRYTASLFLLCLIHTEVLAQIKVYSEVDPKNGSIDDVFQFVITVEGSTSAGGPVLSGGEDFDLRYIGPETRVTVVDGKMNRAVAFVYHLLPKKTGTLITPLAEIKVDSEKHITSPLEVKVSKSGATAHGSDQIFFRQVPSVTTLYKGQQLVLSLDLYHSVPLVSADFVDLTFDNFWSLEFGREKTSDKYLRGERFTVHRLNRALFPLSSGDLELTPKKIRVAYREPSKLSRSFGGLDPFSPGFFDRFFSGAQAKEVLLSSNSSKVVVKELPPVPSTLQVPASPVIVGATSLELRAKSRDIKVGESMTLELIVRSLGNLGPLDFPSIPTPSHVKVYPEKPSLKYSPSGGFLRSTKVFRYSLVGIGGGKVEIPAIHLTYFDPEQERYTVAASKPFQFHVLGPPLSKAHRNLAPQAEPKESEISTQLPLHPKNVNSVLKPSFLSRVQEKLSFSLFFFFVLSLAASLALFWQLRRYIRERERLADSLKRLQKSDTVLELSRSFHQTLGDYLPIDLRKTRMSYQMGQYLERTFPDSTLRDRLLQLFERFDAALYSGAEFTSQEEEHLLKSLKHEILEILPSLRKCSRSL